MFAVIPSQAISLHARPPEGSPRNTWQTTVGELHLVGDRARVHLDGPPALAAEVTPAALVELGVSEGATIWVAVKATQIVVYPDVLDRRHGCVSRRAEVRPSSLRRMSSASMSELDLVAHHRAAALHGSVELHVEGLAADLALGREAGPGAAEGVRPEAVDLELERDRLGHAVQGEVAVHHEVVALGPDTGRG